MDFCLYWRIKGGDLLSKNELKLKRLEGITGSETDIVYLAEEGVISEAIKEGFIEKAFSELKSNLESSLSKKKAKEFMQAFFEELEAAKIDWVETIDEAVTTALQNAVDERAEEAAEIIEPEEFCCKYFM